jgi:hypothetical protein
MNRKIAPLISKDLRFYGSWPVCSSEWNRRLSKNLRTRRTSSQRDEGHPTRPIAISGGPCRAATVPSRQGYSARPAVE